MLMRIKKIKIKSNWKRPTETKMSEKIVYYIDNHKFKDEIVVDKNNYLIDGYTTYILQKEYANKKIVNVRKVRKIDGSNRRNKKGVVRTKF